MLSGPEGSAGEAQELRERLAKFREAALRVNESLDLDAVLQGVLDSARDLTGGRYALIWLVDEFDELMACLTSGMTAEESRGFLEEMPNRWELHEFLTGIEAPILLDDFQGHLAENGLPEFQPPFEVSDQMAYLAAPIRHAGERTGAIFVTEKPGGFSAEDEETLAVFCSQAALVISNARRFEGEKRARADLEGLVNTAPICVVVFDAHTGEVTSLNRVARMLMSELDLSFASAQDLFGSAVFRRADGSEIPGDGPSLEEMLSSGESLSDEEMTLELADGRTVSLMVNATPIASASGKVASVVVAVQDMTAAEHEEQIRTEILGMVGHELRSPLAAIKGSATTLLQGESSLDPAEMSQFFRIIDEQADHMRVLLGDLIDLVRIETGALTVEPAPCALSRIAEEALNTFAGMGGRESIVVEFPPDLPAVMADRNRMVQVVTNLLTNASRHSFEGSVIRVEATAEGHHVAVSVVDSGRGVPAERLPHLFAKFSRPDGPDQGRDLGLGLAICKGIVEAHGGRIWATSDGPGLGSRFTFTVPAADTPDQALARSGAPGGPAGGDAIRVLAVDDDPRALKRIRDALVDEGYEPTVTGDPHQVPALIAETGPSAVLMDLMLPGTDGIELMQDVSEVCDAPVIFLSVYGQKEVVAQALEMGAADYIIKPFSPTELAARIKAALRARRHRSVPTPKDTPELDRFELQELTIDWAAHLVHLSGRPVDLAPVEYRLLAALAANAGTLLTHEQLIVAIWGPDSTKDPSRLRTVVKNIRQKLGDDANNPRYIFTAARVGYRMPKPDTDD